MCTQCILFQLKRDGSFIFNISDFGHLWDHNAKMQKFVSSSVICATCNMPIHLYISSFCIFIMYMPRS
jgi:hypothetical protein